MQSLVIGIVGSGDDGVIASGESLLGAFSQEGYYGMLCTNRANTAPGHELSCRLRVSTAPVKSPAGSPDIVVVHNWEDYRRLRAKLHVKSGAVFVYEQRTGVLPSACPVGGVKPGTTIAVPIEELAEKATGLPWAKDHVVVGLLVGWLGLPVKKIQSAIVVRGGAMETDTQRHTRQAFAAGAAFAKLHPLSPELTIDRTNASERLRSHYCDLLNIV